jgi:hypothetical protein
MLRLKRKLIISFYEAATTAEDFRDFNPVISTRVSHAHRRA